MNERGESEKMQHITIRNTIRAPREVPEGHNPLVNRELSTLELTALGVVWKQGPCTAYAVMREFAGSQTLAYRSGAGSIYPLLKRLRGAGLLLEGEGKLHITPSGIERLRGWAQLGNPNSEVFANLDPLRSRAYFLGVLSTEGQSEFVGNSLRALKCLRGELKDKAHAYERAGQRFSALAMQGALYETEARIKFVKALARALREPNIATSS